MATENIAKAIFFVILLIYTGPGALVGGTLVLMMSEDIVENSQYEVRAIQTFQNLDLAKVQGHQIVYINKQDLECMQPLAYISKQ